MREVVALTIEADDPVAGRELEALARQQGWDFLTLGDHRFALTARDAFLPTA